jgi:CRISPR system Cascade subunit CasC
LILELHALRAVPPSSSNRGQDGSPKSAWFGGAPRTVWSPQAQKRAWRAELTEGPWPGAVRSRHLLPLLSDGLARRGRSDPAEIETVVRAGLETVGLGFPESDPRAMEYLVFAGLDETETMVEVLHRGECWDALLQASRPQRNADGEDGEDGKARKAKKARRNDPVLADVRKALDEALAQGSRSVEIAVAGRMVADRTDLNVEGATYTAFAISTHRSVAEVDWFATVDDLAQSDGAGMLGDSEFVAPVMYSCAVMDAKQLARNLQGDLGLAGQALRAWTWALARTMPTGKDHSMFARVLPFAVLAVIRDHGAYTLADAFAKPVKASEADGDLAMASAQRMLGHLQRRSLAYGEELDARLVVTLDGLEGFAHVQRTSYPALVEAAAPALALP